MDDRQITSILMSILGKDYNPQNIKYKRKEAENDDEETLIIKRKGDDVQVTIIQ